MSVVTEPDTTATIREASMQDADDCGRIFFEAFAAIADRHGFPIEPGSPDFANYKMASLLESDGVFGIVAERHGTIVASAFVDERGPIVGIGPVTVDPSAQNTGVGTALMVDLLRRERARGAAGVRLVQTAYHSRSLAVYAKLGFTVREPLSVLQGNLPLTTRAGLEVRPACDADVAACDALCTQIHGHDRSRELSDAIAQQTAVVAELDGRSVGYATGFGYGWHAVAQNDDAMLAMLSSAQTFMGLGVLVPSRNAELLQWCLLHGLHIVQQAHLMTLGLYNQPAGSWLPSIVY